MCAGPLPSEAGPLGWRAKATLGDPTGFRTAPQACPVPAARLDLAVPGCSWPPAVGAADSARSVRAAVPRAKPDGSCPWLLLAVDVDSMWSGRYRRQRNRPTNVRLPRVARSRRIG